MSSVTFRNLTPHQIKIFCGQNKKDLIVIPPDGLIARVGFATKGEEFLQHGVIDIPVRSLGPGKVEDLPPPANNTILIVSAVVMAALPDTRADVVSPGELVRDNKGQPIGCLGFTAKPGGVKIPHDLCKSCYEERRVSGDAGYCGRCLGEEEHAVFESKYFTATCHVRWICQVKAPSRKAAEKFILERSRENDFLKLDEPDDWECPVIEEKRGLEDFLEVDASGKLIKRKWF